MKYVRWFGILTLLVALMGLVALPQAVYAQESNVEPNSGPPGTEFAFFATGFEGGEQVGVWINNPDGTISEIVDENGDIFVFNANEDGRADWFVTIAPDTPPGFYGMVAQGIDSGYTVTISFEVTAGAPPAEPPPAPEPPAEVEVTYNVEPNSGPAGTKFAYFATGFESGEQVGVWLNTPDGSVDEITDANGDVFILYANDNGRADWSVVIVPDAAPGFYSMVARGVDSGVEVVIPFEVTPGPPPAEPPSPETPTDGSADFNVEPNVGPPGTEFAFFATGFEGGEQVGVWINNPDGSVSEIVDANGDVFVLNANDNGRADWFVTIAPDTPPGFYGMVAQGVDSGVTVVIPFEVE